MKKKATLKKTKAAVEAAVQKRNLQRIEEDAAQVMWQYYQGHRGELIEGIKEFRNDILANLIKGMSPEEAYAPYVITEKLTKAKRRNAKMPVQVEEYMVTASVLLSDLPVRRISGSKF